MSEQGGGYCPECGLHTVDVELRKYNIGFNVWILDCTKCGKWEIMVKK